MYAVRLVIPDGFGPGRPQVVHETRKYTDEAEATAIRDAWRLNLVERSCNGLLAVRDSPGWLRLELVDYTDTPEDSAMPDGWVMDTHEIWQRDVECRRHPCLPELHVGQKTGYLTTPNLLVPESHKQVCAYH